VLDVLVVVIVVLLIAAFVGRRRMGGVGRGLRSGAEEFYRAKDGLPPDDPALREREPPEAL
jgi:hypothetical protein